MPNSPKPRRHPVLANTPPGVWCADAVGKVSGYPKTEEAYYRRLAVLKENADRARAAGRNSRRGTPNGYAGRRDEALAARAVAEAKGWKCMKALRNSRCSEERLDDDELDALKAGKLPTTNAERGACAIVAAMEIVLSTTYAISDRITAARLVIPYLIPKPAKGRLPTRLSDAFAFLDGLLEEEPQEA